MAQHLTYPTIKKPKYRVTHRRRGEGTSSHPIDIVDEVYERVVVARYWYTNDTYKLNDDTEESLVHNIFRSLMQREEVQWAYDNSFDEPHFERSYSHSEQAWGYQISMYLKPEHATFWKLKYG